MTTARNENSEPTPEAQLLACIERLDTENQKLALSIRAAVRKRLPTANELAYDYKSFLVISYSPNERGIDAPLAIAARPTGVSLYFNQGPLLPDPTSILQGSGKQTRFIPVEAASQLARPDVAALIAAALAQATIPLPAEGKGRLIIKSAAAKKTRAGRNKT